MVLNGKSLSGCLLLCGVKMPIFKIIVQEEVSSLYEKNREIQANSLEEALEIAKEEAEYGGNWNGWNDWDQVGDPITTINVFENEEEE